ncbi:hypothetical protein HanRHA438_Chr07g0293871 [Helianthus annuus]|nr:hypothetical protein HanRHA438_Chr07g0293871 [Helianthus annuus]
MELWLEKLKSVTIDGAILGVNVARFTKFGPIKYRSSPVCKEASFKGGQATRCKEMVKRDGRAENQGPVHIDVNAVMPKAPAWNGAGALKPTGNGSKVDQGDDNVLLVSPEITDANEAWNGKSLLAEVKSLELLNNLDTFLSQGNALGAKTSYVGGLKILMCFKDSGTALEFLENQKTFWEVWANSMEFWNGQDTVFCRLVWLIVRGIPLVLWDRGVINSIGERFGRIVQPSEASPRDGCLAYDKIAVVVDHGRKINEEVTLGWRDRRFKVWVHEEEGEWSPSFVSWGGDPASQSKVGVVNLMEECESSDVKQREDEVNPVHVHGKEHVLNGGIDQEVLNSQKESQVGPHGGNEEVFLFQAKSGPKTSCGGLGSANIFNTPTKKMGQ